MSDDEATRPIDLDSLRGGVPDAPPTRKLSSAPPQSLPSEAYPSDEYTAVDAPLSAESLARPQEPAALAEDAPQDPSWITHQDQTLSIPRKSATVEMVGAITTTPSLEDEETQTRLPQPAPSVPAAPPPTPISSEVTTVLPGRGSDRGASKTTASAAVTATAMAALDEAMAAMAKTAETLPKVAQPSRTEDLGKLEGEGDVGAHPSDGEQATRVGHLDADAVRAAFDAAPASEPPASIFEVDSAELVSVEEIEDLSRTGEDEDDPQEETHAFTSARVDEPLPAPIEEGDPPVLHTVPLRWSDQRADPAVLVTARLRPSDTVVHQAGPAARPPSIADVGDLPPPGAARLRLRPTEDVGDLAPPAGDPDGRTKALPRKKAPAFRPPTPDARAGLPAYAVDPDPDEKQLNREQRFGALLDLYRLRLDDADTLLARSTLLHKMASVLEGPLGRPDEAFDTLVTAWEARPYDEDIAASLDRVGARVGRIGELEGRAKKLLHTADPDNRLALLGHLLYWYERHLGRAADVGPVLLEIEKLDKSHPAVLRRNAHLAAGKGDQKTQRESLLRALDRTFRRDEKVSLHLALANSYATSSEAAKHYEAALVIDPTSMVALQGLERIGREHEKLPQVEWALQRQVEVSETESERVNAWLKLAELYETKYLERERAAELLENVLDVEPWNPQALKGLERCYHALRDWPKLARVLRARAEKTYDTKAKVELLELAAEVYESKLGDAPSAIDVHRDILHADPKHKRATVDLARLYEKLGDWGNVATYRAKLAELSPTKRQASTLLVALGDFLATPDKDALAARLQYERAAVVDPQNPAAWEALQRLAEQAGDDRRLVQCMTMRASTLEAPRQRAAAWVDLARHHEDRGDARAAHEAFEQAAKADPSNETAAAAVVDAYANEERWAEAAPLCELLVAAATRDKDPVRLLVRLRLRTRINAALGNVEGAMTAALAALAEAPNDAGAQADLVAVSSQCQSAPEVILRAKEALTRIAGGPGDLPNDALLRLAQIQRASGDVDGAAQTLERARRVDPESAEVEKELAQVYLEQHDYPRACKLMVDIARNATSAEERFKLLCDAGEVWARRAEELEKAASVFEEARQIEPLDHWLLHTLMWVYGELGQWDALTGVLEDISRIQESPERKAKSLFAMGQVVRDKVNDPGRAAELFDQVLDIDKSKLEAFEELVRALTEAKDWERLEFFYRKMIARIQGDVGSRQLEFALFQQLGLVYRDRLGDAAQAYEAFEAAARLQPDDAEVRKIVTELLVVTDNLDNAVMRTRELMARDAHDPELYAELYELFLRQHYFDKAWCAVNVLANLRELTQEQRRFHDDYAPMALGDIPGQIVEQAWRSHLFHADLDETLTRIFALMTPGVARMRAAQLGGLAFRPFTGQHSRCFADIRATFSHAAEILGLPPPELLLGDPAGPAPFVPAYAPYGAFLVHVAAAEARMESLVYAAGKRIAEQRTELAARAFFPSVPDLTALLAAAVRVCRKEGAKDAAAANLDATLGASLHRDELEGIRAIVTQTMLEGGLVDVRRWSQAADLSSMRAGLLLAGDVGPARRSILAEPQSAADLTPREKVGELYHFATSDLYSDLRGAIGVAVST